MATAQINLDFKERVPEIFENLEHGEAKRYIYAVDYETNSDYSLFAEEINKRYGIKGKKVMEVGSGPGLLCLEIAKRGALSVTGIDGSRTMVDYASRVKAQRTKLSNVEFLMCNVYETQLPDNSFDIVVSQNSFHHFSNPEKALHEMIRLTKKGGIVYIADYSRDADPALIRERLDVTKPEVRRDLYNSIKASFTRKELSDFLNDISNNGYKLNYQVQEAKDPTNLFEKAVSFIKNDPIPHYRDYMLSYRLEIRKL